MGKATIKIRKATNGYTVEQNGELYVFMTEEGYVQFIASNFKIPKQHEDKEFIVEIELRENEKAECGQSHKNSTESKE